MAGIIQEPRIFTVAQAKLRVSGQLAEVPSLAPEVALVLDATPWLGVLRIGSATKDLSGGAGTLTTYFTVPTGKRWTLLALRRAPTLAGTRVQIQGLDNTGSAINMPMEASTTGELIVRDFGKGLFLDPSWKIGADTTGNAGDTAIGMQIMYFEEDIAVPLS